MGKHLSGHSSDDTDAVRLQRPFKQN